MTEQQRLVEMIQKQVSPLLAPRPLEHSQQLKDKLPMQRRHVGPRAWYQALEATMPPPNQTDA